jgi:hypothetical protein
MTEFNFYLTPADTDRLFALKAAAGLDALTGNEYAKQLLIDELRRLHPKTVQRDEGGEI